MTSSADHYSTLLAPIYVWMAGGIDAALAQGAADVASLCPPPAAGALAVDLGAGFGMHAIPLARAGYDVVAIDSSAELLSELGRSGTGLGIRAVRADLLDFPAHVTARPALVLCMGDTLTHLPDVALVDGLLADIAHSLTPGGRFVATFRDYTAPPVGDARFIPVRSDADRIHTCFLEEHPQHMAVHDVLYERTGASWRMKVSSYRKLRLSPERVVQALNKVGLTAHVEKGPRGMVLVTATRDA